MNTTTTTVTNTPDTAVTTANYHLSQWDAGDRILRNNFNADNVKIDVAIKAEETARKAEDTRLGVQSKPVSLRSWTTTVAAGSLMIDTTGIDWSHYSMIIIDMHFPSELTFSIDLSGGSTSYTGTGAFNQHYFATDAQVKLYRIYCPLFYCDNRKLTAVSLGSQINIGTSKNLARDITSFTLSPGGSYHSILVGTSVQIWGVN